MLRLNFFLFTFALLSSCTKDMNIQNKLGFQTYVAPEPIAGTVTTSGQDATGAYPSQDIDKVADRALLLRGQDRYNIHCTPCHDRFGSGNGLVVQRGFPKPQAFIEASQKSLTDQEIYEAVTNGYKTMGAYKTFISTDDRVAIVAYVRVLQLAKDFPSDQLDDSDRQALSQSLPKSGGQ